MNRREALRVIFPTLTEREALAGLNQSSLKRAFRKCSFDCHPDRAMALGQSERVLRMRFERVQQAHECLSNTLKVGARRVSQPNHRAQPTAAQPKRPAPPRRATQWTAPPRRVDGRPIYFGEYLVTQGIASRTAVAKALHRQGKLRPRFGQLAVNMGFAARDRIQRITHNRADNQRIGAYLARSGVLTPSQRLAVLGRQRSFCGPLGELLVEDGVMEAGALRKHLRQYFVFLANKASSMGHAA